MIMTNHPVEFVLGFTARVNSYNVGQCEKKRNFVDLFGEDDNTVGDDNDDDYDGELLLEVG